MQLRFCHKEFQILIKPSQSSAQWKLWFFESSRLVIRHFTLYCDSVKVSCQPIDSTVTKYLSIIPHHAQLPSRASSSLWGCEPLPASSMGWVLPLAIRLELLDEGIPHSGAPWNTPSIFSWPRLASVVPCRQHSLPSWPLECRHKLYAASWTAGWRIPLPVTRPASLIGLPSPLSLILLRMALPASPSFDRQWDALVPLCFFTATCISSF